MTNEEIKNYLDENEVYPDEVNGGGDHVSVTIEWGDWKHSHGYCDEVMEEIGYQLDDEEVTEENGSDCYSSIHYYSKVS